MNSLYRNSAGEIVRLGRELGKGGEGTVYTVEGDAGLAAKIYRLDIAQERREKVSALVDARWHATAQFVAYPIEALFERGSSTFAGFTMRKVGGPKPVHQLYSPTGRKTEFPTATFPFLVRAALNVARAVASVHSTGCVIGDINHSGVLVASDATVTLIDSDSFQVSHAGRLYGCKVGVPEFTPPELQGRPLDQVVRTPNHDAFALAVLVFYTLMMGRHPFAGRYQGPGDPPPMEEAIAKCRFAYSARRAQTRMEPPPNAPTLDDLPPALGDAFERAFGPMGASGSGRPLAADWVALLEKAEGEIVRCTQSPAHHHFRTAANCPWCRMERTLPGFLAFVPALSPADGQLGQTFDLGQLISAVRGVPDPGPAPSLASLMPPPPVSPSPAALACRASFIKQSALAAVAAVIAVAFFPLGGTATLLALLVIGICAVQTFRPSPWLTSLRSAEENAKKVWRDAEKMFQTMASDEAFRAARRDAEARLQQLQTLPGEEARRLMELGTRREEAQRRRYLEQYFVDGAKVKGIGNSRKVTLKSYGIETAADVEASRIEAIPGFGPSLVQKLISWRYSVEAGFVFDSNQPASPREVAAVKANIAQARATLEAQVRQGIALLQKLERHTVGVRKDPGGPVFAAWAAFKQVEVDLKHAAAVSGPVRIAAVSLVAVAAGVGVLRTGKTSDHGVVQLASVAAITSPPSASTPATAGTRSDFFRKSGRLRSGRLSVRCPDRAPPPVPQANAGLNWPFGAITPGAVALQTASPSAPTTAIPLLDLRSRREALRVQQRLAELGFLNGDADGVWGPRSRAALREFRSKYGLGSNDDWDDRTQAALMSKAPARANSRPLSNLPVPTQPTQYFPHLPAPITIH